MGFLNIFTMGELVAITMVLLQLILAFVMLRDKRLWRIRQSSEQPSAARGRLEGQGNVGRARRSAQMGLPHGSSPRGSTNSRRRFPRFIRSCQDSQALFEEHRKELEAQWPRVQRGCRAAQPEEPAGPGLLGGKESPQGPGEERPKAGTDGAAGEERAGAAGRGGGSAALAWFVPRDVLIAEAAGSEGSSSSSSSSSSLGLATVRAARGTASRSAPRPRQQQPEERDSGAGCGLLELCSSLRALVAGWWTRHVQRRRSRHVRFASPLVTVRYID
ncbi:unnamed protein product [Coccothraustes coccothraustes]